MSVNPIDELARELASLFSAGGYGPSHAVAKLRGFVRRAILAEREACAEWADGYPIRDTTGFSEREEYYEMGKEVAKAGIATGIRNRPEPE